MGRSLDTPLYCFVCPIVDSGFVPSLIFAKGGCLFAAMARISLWSGSFCQRSSRVGTQIAAYIAQWLPVQQLCKHLLLIFFAGVHPKSQIPFGLLNSTFVVENWVLPEPLSEVSRFFFRKTINISPKNIPFELLMFLNVSISSPRLTDWKKISLVFFCQLVVHFETFFEQRFGQFTFFYFASKVHIIKMKALGSFWEPVKFVIKGGGITTGHQLLQSQQGMVCFNYRIGVPTAELWLTCGARLLLFSRISPWGALGKYLLNSCHHERNVVRV